MAGGCFGDFGNRAFAHFSDGIQDSGSAGEHCNSLAFVVASEHDCSCSRLGSELA